jgi:uncharacterized protein (UPF0261 family)
MTVDIAESGFSSAQVGPHELVRHHPDYGRNALSSSVPEDMLAVSLAAYLNSRRDLGAYLVISAGETLPVALAGAAALPLGVPKMVVTDRHVQGANNDVLHMNAPIGALNRISATLLAHAAGAVVGMMKEATGSRQASKPLICITCVNLVSGLVRFVKHALGDSYDFLVIDMALDSGSKLAGLASSGMVAGIIDLAPVDFATAAVTGNRSGVQRRLDAIRDSKVPYLCVPALMHLSVFSLGMPVPAALLQREVYSTELDGSIVPVSRKEVESITEWFAASLNQFKGPVHILSPRNAIIELGGPSKDGEPEARQADVQRGLNRHVKTQHSRRMSELSGSLLEIDFAEQVAVVMRDLIQQHSL